MVHQRSALGVISGTDLRPWPTGSRADKKWRADLDLSPESQRGPVGSRTPLKVLRRAALLGWYLSYPVARLMDSPSAALMTSARPSERRVLRYVMGSPQGWTRPAEAVGPFRPEALGTPHEPSLDKPDAQGHAPRTVTAVGPIRQVPALRGAGRPVEPAPTSRGWSAGPEHIGPVGK